MTPREVCSSLREWTRRALSAVTGRRTDHDLQRELAVHLALADDELRRKGHAPSEAARLARAAAGGHIQALEALRAQRGLPWLASSWLDLRLGFRLLVKNWGLTLVGGLAMTLAIGIAAVVFAAFDTVLWSPLPLEEGERVVAIQVWDREAGRRRDTTFQDLERWRANLQSVGDGSAFQTIQRNVITPDGSIELAAVAEISAAGFRVASVPPLIGRPIADADAEPGAAPVVVIGHDVWQRRFAGARDVIGRELRLGKDVHTVVGVMPDGFQFPLNFRYWIPLRHGADPILRNTGPEGVVFGRLAPGATLARAHAEVSALGILPALRSAQREGGPPADFGDNLGAITIAAITGSLLLLSAAGLYALMAFTVAQRRREIGIRSALGAQPGHLLAAVFRRAFWQIAAGSGAGMLAASLAGRYVPIEQVGGLPIPGILPGAVAFMLLVGVLAALGPARRGLRIDPTEALRSE